MSALVLSISSQDAYQLSISAATETGQTVAVTPYSEAGKLQARKKQQPAKLLNSPYANN